MLLTNAMLVLVIGFLGGCALGVAARWGRFCTVGAIEDVVYANDWRRIRSWAMAIVAALLPLHAMWWSGWLDLTESFYLSAPLGVVGLVLGGGMFGLGMALTGTCAYGVLARIGGGDLRSVVVFLVIGVSAYATMSGLLAPIRLGWIDPLAVSFGDNGGQHLGLLAARLTGLEIDRIIVLIVAGGLLGWVLRDPAFRASRRHWSSGLIVGTVIASGWYATGVASADSFNPTALQSHSFVAPTGRSLLYAMTSTGSGLDFGIAAVLGVVVGAFATSMLQKRFRWEACDDARELRRHMIGGALMGVGGVLAMGCSVGQGLSAASALTISAPIAILSMLAGARLGLTYMVEGRISLPFLRKRGA